MTLSGLHVVTGGASGIGRAVAERLLADGATVAILDRDPVALDRATEQLGRGVRGVVVDVSREEDVDRAFDELGEVTGLVTCAAVSWMSPIVATRSEDWSRVVSVQLDGTFFCLRAAARAMIHYGNTGSVVAITSVNSRFSHRGNAAYAAAKAGTEMLVRVAAMELGAAGIRVNSVAPGLVVTPMTSGVLEDPEMMRAWVGAVPLGRLGQPDDIAVVVAFLCGADARWITGQSLAADGGSTLRVEPKVSPDEDWTADALRRLIAD